MLGNVALTLITLWLLLGVAALAWTLGGRALDLSPRASRLWSASALVAMAALAALLMRDFLPVGVSTTAGSVLAVGALLLIRRGLLRFLGRPLHDGEAFATLAACLVAEAACLLLPRGWQATGQGVVVGLVLALTLLRTATMVWPGLRAEFGERNAFLLMSPHVAGVALFVLRSAIALLPPWPGPEVQAVPVDTPLNVASALLVLLLVLLLHGNLAAMVLMRLVRKLRHLSQRDALTGLYNRAEWNRQLEGQHRWLGRFGEAFGVLMIDIDHFKRINDTLGHAAGDAVLITVAQVLTASAREVDVIGRLGGEEFGVLLPRAEQMTVRRAAERLRQMLGDAETTWRGQPIRLTVSIGAALCTDADESPQHVLERADHALYQAKNGGRNRTVVARLAN